MLKKRYMERVIEAGLFSSRWLLAPFYIGLSISLAAMLIVFARTLFRDLIHIADMKAEDAILMSLSLIDLSLSANLLLIVIYSGYENFVSRIEVIDDEDRPRWMGKIDFSGLKMKLIASIVAISAIALLRAFMEMGDHAVDSIKLGWMMKIHLTFVVSGVLLAAMDWLNSRTEGNNDRITK